MLYVDQFVYTNKLRVIHPLEKVLFSLVTMGISLAAGRDLVALVVLALMLGLLFWKAKISAGVLLKLFSVPLGFLSVGLLTIAVVVSRQPESLVGTIRLGSFYLGFTNSSLELAWKTGVTSFSAISCLYFLALTTPMTEIVYALRLLKLPALLIELMTLIYRFIFLFLETAMQIYTAQSSRWGYGTFKRSLHSWGLLLANVWGRAFFKIQTLFTGLVSRGYEQDLRFLDPKQHYSGKTIALFAAADLTLLVLALI